MEGYIYVARHVVAPRVCCTSGASVAPVVLEASVAVSKMRVGHGEDNSQDLQRVALSFSSEVIIAYTLSLSSSHTACEGAT